MIEKLEIRDFVINPHTSQTNIEVVTKKLNELIESYNQHIHYARVPTSTPNNTNPHS